MVRLLIVSNRLPIQATLREGEVGFKASPGGLATGLRHVLEQHPFLWLGWPGDTSSWTDEQREILRDRMRREHLEPLFLSAADVRGYYGSFANGALWPLLHSLPSLLPPEIQGWEDYIQVNQQFAEAVEGVYQEGDIIWVHDFHLLLLPHMLRERMPRATIGFFLHIPFPPSDEFRILPHREAFLRGMLGADVIGFHTPLYANHFTSAILRLLGLTTHLGRVRLEDGRAVRVGSFPLGVDVKTFSQRYPDQGVQKVIQDLRRDYVDRKIFFAVDRVDYTKGILQRLLAFERFLEQHPQDKRNYVMLQIAVPSRMDVAPFESTKRVVDEIVGRINGRFGEPDYQPIHYMSRTFSQQELAELYRSVDVMVVTPLRDGMNLVAKEFCASRVDDDGVLILSEFAGAATEMGEALIVNPYDSDAMVRAYRDAAHMSVEERRRKMRFLRERLQLLDSERWGILFLASIAEAKNERDAEHPPTAIEQIAVEAEDVSILVRDKPLVLLLDYDGCLVPIATTPEKAAPDPELLRLLHQLLERDDLYVSVVSGRSRDDLSLWFKHLPLHLFAEHGAWERPPGGVWRARLDASDAEWKKTVQEVLHTASIEVPGSFVEEKSFALVWHFRMADPRIAETKARELQFQLTEMLATAPLMIIPGKKILEVRHAAVHKGDAVTTLRYLLGELPYQFVAIGDDITDEDMFRHLPREGISIHVGEPAGLAQYVMRDPATLRRWLGQLVARPRRAQLQKKAN